MSSVTTDTARFHESIDENRQLNLRREADLAQQWIDERHVACEESDGAVG